MTKGHPVQSKRRCVGRARLLGLLLAVLGSISASARADSLPEVFSRGNAAYARSDYVAAVQQYETLIEAGVTDANVSYDLACAYGSLGRYGAAIRFFERSLHQDPGNDAAERGLKLARDLLGERQAKERGEAIVAERPPLSSALFAALSENTLALALLSSVWLWCLSLLGLLRARSAAHDSARAQSGEAQRIGLGIASVFFLTTALVTGFGLWAKSDFGAEGHRAIVLVDHAPVREGPDAAARLSAELSEGESVRILAHEGEFAHVRLGRGSEGFVPRAAVGEI
jgi:tetratricopeptide (TPR) repeat protein